MKNDVMVFENCRLTPLIVILHDALTYQINVAKNSFFVSYLVYMEAKQLKLYFADGHHILPWNQDDIKV